MARDLLRKDPGRYRSASSDVGVPSTWWLQKRAVAPSSDTWTHSHLGPSSLGSIWQEHWDPPPSPGAQLLFCSFCGSQPACQFPERPSLRAGAQRAP